MVKINEIKSSESVTNQFIHWTSLQLLRAGDAEEDEDGVVWLLHEDVGSLTLLEKQVREGFENAPEVIDVGVDLSVEVGGIIRSDLDDGMLVWVRWLDSGHETGGL